MRFISWVSVLNSSAAIYNIEPYSSRNSFVCMIEIVPINIIISSSSSRGSSSSSSINIITSTIIISSGRTYYFSTDHIWDSVEKWEKTALSP